MDYKFLWLRIKSYLFNKTLRIRRKFGYRTPIEIAREKRDKLQEETNNLARGMADILKDPPVVGDKFNSAVDLFKRQRLDEELDQIINKYGNKVTADQIYEFYHRRYSPRTLVSDVDCNVKAERMIEYLKEITN